MSTSVRQAKIISFYSFKGGAGRTMALANAAWIMASQGKSVLVIDWDLEAPDLHAYYGGYLPMADLSVADGVLDMFRTFAQAAASAADAEAAEGDDDPAAEVPLDLRALHPEHTDFERYQVDLDHPFPDGGRLHYLGPGRMDDGYANRLAEFDWAGFHGSDDGAEFLEALRARMHGSDYDYILIDSRTGFSDGAGICTLALPDTVLLALTLNKQAIQGARKIAERIHQYGRPIELHVAPMRIDSGEQDRLDLRRQEARRALDPYLGITGEDALDTYWGALSVPYLPYYAYGEELAVMRDNPRHADSLLAAYVRLVDRITDGAVQDFRPVPVGTSRAYQRALAHRERLQAEQQTEPCTVTFLHAPNDQLWADWIGELLRPTGVRIVPPDDKPADGADAPPDSDYVLALLSPHLKGTRAGDTIARLTTGAPPARGPHHQQVIGVRVSSGRLAPHHDFDRQETVSLAGQSEEAARWALLDHFGLRPGTDAADRAWSGPRFPGNQPAVWEMPLPNDEFVGRVEQLDALRHRFEEADAGFCPPQVLSGLTGVGKREIALEYAHRFASQYDLVWWVPAGTTEGIESSFTRLARAVDAAGDGRHTDEDRQALLDDLRLGRIGAGRRWLLVLDGAENQQAVQAYIPTGGHGHVLITSTSTEWTPEYNRHTVGVFTPEESLALLGRRLPGPADEELLRLAERVGHLAIAEVGAAAVLQSSPQDIDLYIELLDSGETTATEEVAPEYRDFTQVCRLAYEDLRERSAAAARLLDLCAFLSPDGVGVNVVQSNAMLNVLRRTDPALGDAAFYLYQHLKLLGDQGLAAQDARSGTLKVPRVVQDLVRGWMTEEERTATHAEVLEILASMVPNDLERHQPRHAETFAELDKHVIVSGAVDSAVPEVHRWLVSQVYHRWSSGEWKAARRLGELVLDRWRQDLGEEHLMVLRMESQLGAACRLLGDYGAALDLTSHAVTTLRRTGESEPDLLLASRGHAADLRAVGKFREAFEADQTTFSGLATAIGDNSNGTLAASFNLALSKFYFESVEAAIRQEQQGHERRAQISTDKDHKPWVSYTYLGTYHREKGELDASEQHLTEASKRLNQLLGPDSHHTLGALAGLGMTMVRQGNLQHALPLLNNAYVAFRDQWGEEHPGTMSCRLSLSIGLHAAGRTSDAISYTRDVLVHYRQVFGEDHPFTGICRNNLALYLLGCEEAEEADEHARKAVLQLKESLGRTHRYTLVARMNRNNCVTALGSLPSGERSTEDEDIYEGCRAPSAWGEHHPVTLTALANLQDSRGRPDDEQTAGLRRKVDEYVPKGHPLAEALSADPYTRIGADLEVQGV